MEIKRARQQKKLQVRFISDELLDRMRELAQEDNRSLNGEVMQAIEEFIARRPGRGDRDRNQA